MKIFVRTPGGTGFHPETIDSTTTPADLFDEGDGGDVYLTFNNKVLEDDKPLVEQGVIAGSELHCEQRQRGGAPDDDDRLPTLEELGLPPDEVCLSVLIFCFHFFCMCLIVLSCSG